MQKSKEISQRNIFKESMIEDIVEVEENSGFSEGEFKSNNNDFIANFNKRSTKKRSRPISKGEYVFHILILLTFPFITFNYVLKKDTIKNFIT